MKLGSTPHFNHAWISITKTRSWPIVCSVVDLLRGANSSVNMSVQDSHSQTDSASTATEILETLRQHPQTACLRVVLWWLSVNEGASPKLLDVCGLGLKISPQSFEALNDKASVLSIPAPIRQKWPQPFQPIDPFQPAYTAVGNQIATTARNYILDQADTPPIILLVGWEANNTVREHIQQNIDSSIPQSYLNPDMSPFPFLSVEKAHKNDT